MALSPPPMPFTPLTGKCGCGALRYRIDAPPFHINACHCRYCQRETGTAHALNYGVEADNVKITAGDENLITITIPSESGKGQPITRCSTCQVGIFSEYQPFGPLARFIRVGTLDEIPDWIKPDVHIFTSSKLPWVVIPEGVKSFPEYPPKLDYLPEESVRRRDALLAKSKGQTT